MVLLSVANSVNMTLFERVAEFGTMRALGERASRIVTLVLLESAIAGVIGGASGVLIGYLLSLLISTIGIPMPPPPNANVGYTALIRTVPSELAVSFLVGFIATVAAAVLPARRIVRIPIVDALRQSV
jgi:putative ABC transport system permease protein